MRYEQVKRKLMACAIVAITMLTIMPICPTYSDADPVIHNDQTMVGTRTSSNSSHYYYMGYHDVYSSSALGFWGSRWSNEYDCWAYGCKIAGGFCATGTYGFPSHGMIQAAAFSIDIPYNSANAYVSTIQDDDFIWSTVQSTERSNIDHISTLLISLVLSFIGNVGVSLTWAVASEVIGALCNGYDTVNNTSKSLWYLWEWIPQINEADQTMSFTAYVKNNHVATFRANYHVFGQGFELLTAGPMVVVLSGIDTSQLKGPSAMSTHERDEAGIITIKRSDLRDYMVASGYPESYIVEALNEYEEEYYFMADIERYISIEYVEISDHSINDTHISEYVEKIRNDKSGWLLSIDSA